MESEAISESLAYNNADSDKSTVYAEGIIKHFTFTDNDRSLYFDGNTIDGSESIRRNIKLSKRVTGYRSGNNSPIPRNEFPKKSDIYKARVILETWEWNGHKCKRVLAFELDEFIGRNDSYAPGSDEIINPFSFIDEADNISLDDNPFPFFNIQDENTD